jgi:hypothetical protein
MRAPLIVLSLIALSLIALASPVAAAPDAAKSSFGIPGCNGPVHALLALGDDLYAGGEFTMAGGVDAGGIARWDGSGWYPLGKGISGEREFRDSIGNSVIFPAQVQAIIEYEGDIIVGGSFHTAGDDSAHSIARWDGTSWHPLGPGLNRGATFYSGGVYNYFPPVVSCLAVYDGLLIAGGTFEASGDQEVDFVGAWDGQSWTEVGSGLGGGQPPRVLSLRVDEQGLLVGGDFLLSGLSYLGRIGRWNGTTWAGLASGMDRAVHALTGFGGEIVAGGEFGRAGSESVARVALWQGEDWVSLGSGPPNTVHCLATYQGDLWAGAFRWTGAEWTNVLQTNGVVYALAEYRGALVAGGDFSLIAMRPAWNIAAWPSDDLVPIYLESFRAERQEDGTALLKWVVAEGATDVDFRVWRGEDPATGVRLPGRPEPQGQTYLLRDASPPPGVASYWLEMVPVDQASSWLGSTQLAAASATFAPLRPVLRAVHPNPCNPLSRTTFTLARGDHANVSVHDARGRRVAVLLDRWLAAGEHAVAWDGRDSQGRDAPSGVYFLHLTTSAGSATRKITLTR